MFKQETIYKSEQDIIKIITVNRHLDSKEESIINKFIHSDDVKNAKKLSTLSSYFIIYVLVLLFPAEYKLMQ